MATPIATLKVWFASLKKPTQAQFWAWLDSYRHKDDPITINDLHINLQNVLQNAGGGTTLPQLPTPVLTVEDTGNTITLAWTHSYQGHTYQLEMDDSNAFPAQNRIYYDRQKSIELEKPSSTKYFRVRELGFEHRNSPWSNVLVFVAGGGPVTPTFPTPTGFVVVEVDKTTNDLKWDANGADVNIIEYSTSSNFAAIIGTIPVNSGNTRQVQGLTPNTQYYYRLQAKKAGYLDSGYAYTDGKTIRLFNTVLDFEGGKTQSASPVTVTVENANALERFEFDMPQTISGTPVSMLIKINNVNKAFVNLTTGFVGQPFRYITPAGKRYEGVITSPSVNFQP